MSREFHLAPAMALGHMKVTTQGDPRDLASDLFHAMQHNRVVAQMLMAAVAMYMVNNDINPMTLAGKVEKIEEMRTFIPPTETEPGNAGKRPGEG